MVSQRILHLTDVNLETAYFRSIARFHDQARFPVTIGCLASGGTLQQAMTELGAGTFALAADGRGQYPLAILNLARLLRKEQIAVVHAHCFDPTIVGLFAARVARTKFVFTRHHSDHNIRLGKRWHTRIDAYCARNADHVMPVSNATAEIMTTVEGVAQSQLTVVYNGMEPLRVARAEDAARLRAELNLGGEFVCLMIARMHEEKGHKFLFEALPKVIERVGPVRVLLAGDGPELEAIQRAAVECGVANHVSFLGRRNDIPELIALADLAVLPSLAESFGFAALEAMSLGKPVVVSDAGGLPEVVENNITGLVVPRANADQLAQAMIELLSDRERSSRMGANGRKRAAEFTFGRMMRGYESVYDRVLADKNERRLT